MQRRQSIPHTFEEIIAAEKARLEAQVPHLPPGPQKDRLLKKDQPAGDSFPCERVADLAGTPKPA
jgi:hypothetical protein